MPGSAPIVPPPLRSSPTSGLPPEKKSHLRIVKSDERPKQKQDIFHESIDPNEIGTGRFYTSGDEYSWWDMGLWKALRNLKSKKHRASATTANLSWDNLRKFHDLLEPELKKRAAYPLHGRALTTGQRKRLNKKGKILVKKSIYRSGDKKFTKEDLADFKKVTALLHEKNLSEPDKKLVQKYVMPINSPEGNYSRSTLPTKDAPLPVQKTSVKASELLELSKPQKSHLRILPSIKNGEAHEGSPQQRQIFSSQKDLDACERAMRGAENLDEDMDLAA